jgi:hypothetical protein
VLGFCPMRLAHDPPMGDIRRRDCRSTWRATRRPELAVSLPATRGFSLILKDGDTGRVLATCWGGCDRADVLAELRRCGLLGGDSVGYRLPSVTLPRRDNATCDATRTARALAIWHESRPIAGTIAERYLISRGIVLDELSAEVRANLRYHLGCPRPRDDAGNFVPPLPAMLALVEHSERGPMAIHATYLRPDGSGKAAIANPKAMFGPIGGGAVRFGMPCSGGMARNRRGHRDRACGSYRVRAAGMGSTFGRRYPRARAAARGDPPPDLCWS